MEQHIIGNSCYLSAYGIFMSVKTENVRYRNVNLLITSVKNHSEIWWSSRPFMRATPAQYKWSVTKNFCSNFITCSTMCSGAPSRTEMVMGSFLHSRMLERTIVYVINYNTSTCYCTFYAREKHPSFKKSTIKNDTVNLHNTMIFLLFFATFVINVLPTILISVFKCDLYSHITCHTHILRTMTLTRGTWGVFK